VAIGYVMPSGQVTALLGDVVNRLIVGLIVAVLTWAVIIGLKSIARAESSHRSGRAVSHRRLIVIIVHRRLPRLFDGVQRSARPACMGSASSSPCVTVSPASTPTKRDWHGGRRARHGQDVGNRAFRR
jgi:hypothetical protein